MKTHTLIRISTATGKAPIAALAQKCLDAKKEGRNMFSSAPGLVGTKGVDCEQWESEINSLVSKLYGL